MFAYLVRRLALMLVTLLGISIVIFFLLRIVPGNIVDILFAAGGYVDPADKANLERELGIDQPLVLQYLQWIGGLLRGDLGYSYVSEKPALQEILPRIPITARLAGLALMFSASIGIPLGVISAVKQGTRLDYVLRVVSLSGLSLPSFWLGLLILMASVAMFGTMPIFNPNPRTWTEAFAIYCVPAMAVGFRLSTELIAGVGVGAAIGWVFDRLLSTSPFGFILFFLLGFVAGVVNVVRSAGAASRNRR